MAFSSYIQAFLAALFLTTSCTHLPKGTEALSVTADHPIPLSGERRTPAAQDVDWWTANEKQIQSALCRERLPMTASEIAGFYKRQPLGPGYDPGEYEILGIRLKNERPELVLALSKLLSVADHAEKPDKSVENFQKMFQINPSCDKALCAAQRIFGKEVGPQMLFLMERFDVNTSPYSFSNASVFRPDEIADVIRTFELTRPDQLPFRPNKKLIKFSRGYTRAIYGAAGGSIVANASIELFDSWTEDNSHMRQYSLYHEIAHNHSNSYFNDYDVSKSWLDLSNWKEKKSGQFSSDRARMMRGHPFVSKYGKTNPAEDFAESVTAYRLNPALLKRQSMEKYNLIRFFIHDGLQFEKSVDCQNTPDSQRLQKEVLAYQFQQSDKETVLRSCRQAFYESILGHLPISFFDSCVNYEAAQIWYRQTSNRYPDLIPQAFFDQEYGFSFLKFPQLREQIARELQPEAVDWILSEINTFSYQLKSEMSNKDYCEKWTQLEKRVFPDIMAESAWRYRRGFTRAEYSPKAAVARRVCLELVDRYTPPSKSSLKSILDWMKETAHISTQGPLIERGVNRDSLLKYVVDRTSPPRY